MNFYRPLLLPSNNVVYNSLIEIKELDISFLLQMRSSFLDASESDLVYSIIKKYTNIYDPHKLYYKDAQYLYYFFLSMLNKSDEIRLPNICTKCNDNINIKINLSKFQTKYADKEDFLEKEYKIKDFTFYFRNRLLEDNIISGIVNFENEKKDVTGIINYLKPQCIKIIHNDEIYDNSNFEDACSEIGLENVIKIFEELRNESWGIDSFFLYICKKCGNENKAFISDPYRSSYYGISKSFSANLEILELLIQLSSFKILSFEDLLSIPLSLWEPTVQYINQLIKKKYGGKNSTGYLEQFHEEFQ
jgi:hypothetical protein